LSLVQNVQTGSGTLSASYRMGTGVLSQGSSGGVVRVTTHLHLLPRLIMSDEIFLISLHCFKCVQRSTFAHEVAAYDSKS